MIIAIDGPAGVGKSTVARALAERFGFAYINTGAMYRAVALAALEAGLQLPRDTERVVLLAQELPITLRDNGRRTCIGDRDVSELITSLQVGELASRVATLPGVRCEIVQQQRRL